MQAPLDGRPAVTHARVVARSPIAAALEVDLETGRTRQIRRHLMEQGCPVVGETAAGARTNARLLLHAFELRLPWAGAAGALTVTAPPPEDFTSAAQALTLVVPSI
jgi:23S rRNA pseudouridine1911/1915/1917 synthase